MSMQYLAYYIKSQSSKKSHIIQTLKLNELKVTEAEQKIRDGLDGKYDLL